MPLAHSFDAEFRTNVVTCKTRSAEYFLKLEVRRFASLPRTVGASTVVVIIIASNIGKPSDGADGTAGDCWNP